MFFWRHLLVFLYELLIVLVVVQDEGHLVYSKTGEEVRDVELLH
jgi:hypothetical protein